MYLDEARIKFLKREGIPALIAEMAGTSVSLVKKLKYKQAPVSGVKSMRIVSALDKLMQLTKETQQQNEKENKDNPGHPPAIELPPK